MNDVKGSQLDALVAIKVMGWGLRPDKTRGATWVDAKGHFEAEAECGTEYGSEDEPCRGECDDDCLRFRPSSDPKDAREVLKALKERGIILTVKDPEPENICRAALEAVGK